MAYEGEKCPICGKGRLVLISTTHIDDQDHLECDNCGETFIYEED